MKFAVFGRPGKNTINALRNLISYCSDNGDELLIHKFFMEDERFLDFEEFDKTFDFSSLDLAISIGGDGTFIRLSQMIAPFGTPIIGVNTGRLGFLADVSSEDIGGVLDDYKADKCSIEERSMLKLESDSDIHLGRNIAINEISILRQDTSSLLVINLYADGKRINNYWADGLIIATPTGSTAYSMAAGGPIVAPDNESFVITPISPHSLTVRPLIISNKCKLEVVVESRSDHYLAAVDSTSETVNIKDKLYISLLPIPLKVVKQQGYDYYSTLREKLMWGKDKRES